MAGDNHSAADVFTRHACLTQDCTHCAWLKFGMAWNHHSAIAVALNEHKVAAPLSIEMEPCSLQRCGHVLPGKP